jgi:hypothetical protein
MHLKVLPVKALSPPAPVGFIRVKDRTLTPLAEPFAECARRVASPYALSDGWALAQSRDRRTLA